MTGSGSKSCGQKCVLQGLLGAPLSLLGAPGFTPRNTETMHTMLKPNNAYQVTIQSHMAAAHNNNTFELIALSSSPYRFPWFATHFQPWDLSSRSFCMNLVGFCSYGVCVFCWLSWLTVREFQRMEPNLASILNAAFKFVHTMSKMQWITSRDFSNQTKSNPAPQGPKGYVPKFQPRMFARKKYAAHRRSHA